MNKKLVRISLSNSVYFSVISFIIIWITGFLYEGLKKTTGSLSMGKMLVIMLSLILVLFFLAITHIILYEPRRGRISFTDRILAVVLFIIISATILAILALLFWYRI